MKQLFIYANDAKKEVAIYDLSKGTVSHTEATATESAPDIDAYNMLKTIITAKKDENFNIICNAGLTLPVLEAMKIWKYAVNEDFNAEDVAETADYEKYLTRIASTGIDIDTVDKADPKVLKSIAVAGMTNDWTDKEAIDFMLTLALIPNKYTFRNFNSLLEDDDRNHSELEKMNRGIAQDIAKKCALPKPKDIKVKSLAEL